MKKNYDRLIEWLDDRYNIIQFNKRKTDEAYYEGAIQALVKAGFYVERTPQGTHKVYLGK